jgi:hypothetical protein
MTKDTTKRPRCTPLARATDRLAKAGGDTTPIKQLTDLGVPDDVLLAHVYDLIAEHDPKFPRASYPQLWRVMVRAEPRSRLHMITAPKEEIEAAVNEAELMAHVLESPDVTADLRRSARLLMIGACISVAQGLNARYVDPQMCRDIFVYARLLNKRTSRATFEVFAQQAMREMPDLFKPAAKRKGKRAA